MQALKEEDLWSLFYGIACLLAGLVLGWCAHSYYQAYIEGCLP